MYIKMWKLEFKAVQGSDVAQGPVELDNTMDTRQAGEVLPTDTQKNYGTKHQGHKDDDQDA